MVGIENIGIVCTFYQLRSLYVKITFIGYLQEVKNIEGKIKLTALWYVDYALLTLSCLDLIDSTN